MDKWLDTRLEEHSCPHCGHKLDAVGQPHGYSPEPGDISVCIWCAGIMVFDNDLMLRLPTSTERLEALCDEEVQKFRAIVRQLKQ